MAYYEDYESQLVDVLRWYTNGRFGPMAVRIFYHFLKPSILITRPLPVDNGKLGQALGLLALWRLKLYVLPTDILFSCGEVYPNMSVLVYRHIEEYQLNVETQVLKY